jgi:hypothetical protein
MRMGVALGGLMSVRWGLVGLERFVDGQGRRHPQAFPEVIPSLWMNLPAAALILLQGWAANVVGWPASLLQLEAGDRVDQNAACFCEGLRTQLCPLSRNMQRHKLCQEQFPRCSSLLCDLVVAVATTRPSRPGERDTAQREKQSDCQDSIASAGLSR